MLLCEYSPNKRPKCLQRPHVASSAEYFTDARQLCATAIATAASSSLDVLPWGWRRHGSNDIVLPLTAPSFAAAAMDAATADRLRFGTTSMGYAREVAELFLGRPARASIDQVTTLME